MAVYRWFIEVGRRNMARVYYVRDGGGGPASQGEELDIEAVVERFRGHRKVPLGPRPPALRPGGDGRARKGRPYVLIEVGPEEVRPPEFLDIGFYRIG